MIRGSFYSGSHLPTFAQLCKACGLLKRLTCAGEALPLHLRTVSVMRQLKGMSASACPCPLPARSRSMWSWRLLVGAATTAFAKGGRNLRSRAERRTM